MKTGQNESTQRILLSLVHELPDLRASLERFEVLIGVLALEHGIPMVVSPETTG
jgi:hypothetical protein